MSFWSIALLLYIIISILYTSTKIFGFFGFLFKKLLTGKKPVVSEVNVNNDL